MQTSREIVVIGGSAGAVEALPRVMRGLPAALAARVFVTIHIPPVASALPAIVTRAGPLVARHPADGELTAPSRVYVAPPDRHLLVRPGQVSVVAGPRENGHRPAVDPLFRSAAAAYGPRVVAVVLSGNLDDGAAGARAVHAAGGTVLVQDPAECAYPGMPTAALAAVPGAEVMPLDRIAARIVELLATPLAGVAPAAASREFVPLIPPPVEMEEPRIDGSAHRGTPSGFTCPECHGGVFELDVAGTQQYRCRVGHAFTAEVLLAEQGASVEAALWTALRALEDSAEMAERLERRARQRGNALAAEAQARAGVTYGQRARAVRALLRAGTGAEVRGIDGPGQVAPG